MKKRTDSFLHDLPFFADLPEADMQAFLQASQMREYKKHESIFLQGDTANRFFVVMDGWVELYRDTSEGEEAVSALFARGDVFGEAAIFGSAEYPFSAKAAEETHLLEIPEAILHRQAKKNPDIMARVMSSMSREIRSLQIENEHLALMSAPQRVGCLLLQLSGRMMGTGGTFSFPYDKSLAAARLGMKPETFSRALSQLKPFGVTVKGSEVAIDSFSKLSCYCCVHCSALAGECRNAHGISCLKKPL